MQFGGVQICGLFCIADNNIIPWMRFAQIISGFILLSRKMKKKKKLATTIASFHRFQVQGWMERERVCVCMCGFLFLMGFLPFCTQKLNKETNQFLVWNALIASNGEMKLGAGAVEVHTSIAFSSYVKFSWLVCWESLQPIEQKWVILLCCVGLQGEPKKKKKQLLLASGLAQEVYQNFVDNTGLA